jgi:hypothetical protein
MFVIVEILPNSAVSRCRNFNSKTNMEKMYIKLFPNLNGCHN